MRPGLQNFSFQNFGLKIKYLFLKNDVGKKKIYLSPKLELKFKFFYVPVFGNKIFFISYLGLQNRQKN